MREFNTTGICVPNMHYMVDISEKVEKIFKMVEGAKYFMINRGRQYGKTTTIGRLRKRLIDDGNYNCISISFQYTTKKMFTDEASNNELFVQFLKMLRDKYLFRNAGDDYTFHSVILAGVYDIRNLKQKMILSGKYMPSTGESMMNSPWNIAVDFDIDMSFSAKDIETMLVEYENDHHTGMNISEIAQEIRSYTNGYPYLVSRICWLIETRLDRNWTLEGVHETGVSRKSPKVLPTKSSVMGFSTWKNV